MKKLFKLILFIILSINLILSAKDNSDTILTDREKIFGLMTIWSHAKFGFPYPEKLELLNWDKKVQEFIPKVIKSDNVDEYYFELMKFATLLENSHTSVIPPWGYFKPGFDMPPIEVSVIDEKFIIKRTGINEEIKSYEIVPGIEILAVNDIPIRDYFIENVLKYYSQGSKQANEAVLPIYLLTGPIDEKVNIKVKYLDGKIKNLLLTRSSINTDGSPFLYEFVKNIFVETSITIKEYDNNIIYIKIPNFDSAQIGNEFINFIENTDLDEINGIIFDVRNNMGGNSKICNQIVSCMIDQPVSSPSMKYHYYSAAKKAWGKETKWIIDETTIKPRKGKVYCGPIVVLTDAVTNSTAEDFVVELIQNNRTTVVGQTTAGGAGNTLEIDLPYGGKFRLATFRALLPDGSDYMGKGIKPDIEINLNVEDVSLNVDNTFNKGMLILKNF